MFYLNQLSVHNNQLMLWPQNWYSTGYIAMHIHCIGLQCRTLYTSPCFPSFLVIIKLKLSVRHT